METFCLVAGVLFFAGIAYGMAMVAWAGVLQAFCGPGWARRAGGLALVVIMASIVFICVYGLTECVRLLRADV